VKWGGVMGYFCIQATTGENVEHRFSNPCVLYINPAFVCFFYGNMENETASDALYAYYCQ
jgi:hypothetical protein